MTLSTETLMAYIDAELSDAEMRRVEAEIAAQPELQAYIEQQQMLRRGLHDAFDNMLAEPVPDRLLAAVAQPASWRWRLAGRLRELASRRTLIWSGIPAAAALSAGLVIGVMLGGPSEGNIVSGAGGLLAHGPLATALTHQLAAQPTRTAAAKIGISFRDKSGRYCRSFETRGAAPVAGVACHAGGDWHIAALAQSQAETGAGAAYQPAGSAMPDAVRSAVAGLIAGAPLDAAAERAARDGGWNKK